MKAIIEKKAINTDVEIGGAGPTHYEVFARVGSKDPLAHVGSIDAPNLSLAKARAYYVFDQLSWCEMLLVPTAAMVPVLNTDHFVRIKGA